MINLWVSFISWNFLALIVNLVSAGKHAWSYTAQNDWDKQCITGFRQSPIDIDTKRVSVNTSLAIDTQHYDQEFRNFRISNNGHTATLSIDLQNDETQHPFITGLALDNQVYMFAQLHFHWSTLPGKGSEHAINGKRYSMEMHLVHFNKKYENITEAVNHSDGLAVIGVLFDIKRKDNPHLDGIVEGVVFTRIEGAEDFQNLNRFRQSQKIPSIKLINLLPDDLDTFFRYKGSLTTPECQESVTWLLYRHTTDIGLKQIESFRVLVNRNKVLLGDTFRHLQLTHDRKIEVSKKLDKSGNGSLAAHLNSNYVVTQLSLIASLLMLAKY